VSDIITGIGLGLCGRALIKPYAPIARWKFLIQVFSRNQAMSL